MSVVCSAMAQQKGAQCADWSPQVPLPTALCCCRWSDVSWAPGRQHPTSQTAPKELRSDSITSTKAPHLDCSKTADLLCYKAKTF